MKIKKVFPVLTVVLLTVFFASNYVSSKSEIEALSGAYENFLTLKPPQKVVSRLKSNFTALQKADKRGELSDSLFSIKAQQLVDFMGANNPLLLRHEILFIEREQFARDHHNTATIFQKGEINEDSFSPGAAIKSVNLKSKKVRTIFETQTGVVRDPEISYDGSKILFSYRKDKDDDYHIYEINTDGSNLKQLTHQQGVSDIDPLYLPDGNIAFSSTREYKFCMCNRHIMANLYRMEADGANITQIGNSTLFEGHASMLNDGRIIYDRWEYVDRNFGDAQGLWTVNPDGTNHSIYYGNNTPSPGGIIDARSIPGSNKIICIFSSCHDRPWGAIAILDRYRGLDNEEGVIQIWPEYAYKHIGAGNWDQFMKMDDRYEDPYPVNEKYFFASKNIIPLKKKGNHPTQQKMAIALLDIWGNETIVYESEKNCFSPMPITNREKQPVLPHRRDYSESPGTFIIQNVYEGTHMQGIKKGEVKYLRVVESPEKQAWTVDAWSGQGAQAPAVNWSSFETKRILGEVPVEEDGSCYVEVPGNTFVFFQLLDKEKKMIQSMRSGTMLMPNERASCVGCHENRLSVPVVQNKLMALKNAPGKLTGWKGEPRSFSYAKEVQPIFDAKCVQCHDFGKEAGEILILAGDRNTYFNASYIDMYVKKVVSLIGGGPAEIQQPKTWGSHASRLTKYIDREDHGEVALNQDEREIIYAWMDLNGVYYPYYESAYPDNPAGRSPLTKKELEELYKLTGINVLKLNGQHREIGAQIAFERPELSPCLIDLDEESEKYKKALAMIQLGQQRLKETPRADMDGFLPCEKDRQANAKYDALQKCEVERRKAILEGRKVYDIKALEY
jgi:hypothetical protein